MSLYLAKLLKENAIRDMLEINLCRSGNKTVEAVLSDEVNLSSGSERIMVRLLHSWEARNFKRNRELMSLDLLLLDEKDCLIQASINHTLLDRFSQVKEGRVFIIKDFEVVKTGIQYKLTDHKFMIRFNNTTTMEEVEDKNDSIQNEKYRIRCYDELMKLADKNEELPDVIGFLCNIHKHMVVAANGSKRLMLRILLEKSLTAYITIWDDLADYFMARLQEIHEEAIVIVATSINPKTFSGNLYLSTTSASRIYLNPNFNIEKDFRNRMRFQQKFNHFLKAAENIKTEEKLHSISDILKFISMEKEQEKEFTCSATVSKILTKRGWNYIACSKCSKKMSKTETALICNNCINSVGVLRFRVEVEVDDGNDTSTFVIFDKDVKQLTNKTASELMNEKEKNSDCDGKNQTTPTSILNIARKKYKFQVKVTPYNFKTRDETFTVTRIWQDGCMTETKDQIPKAEGTSYQEAPLKKIKIESIEKGPRRLRKMLEHQSSDESEN